MWIQLPLPSKADSLFLSLQLITNNFYFHWEVFMTHQYWSNAPIQGLSTIFKKAPGIKFFLIKSQCAKPDWLFRRLGTRKLTNHGKIKSRIVVYYLYLFLTNFFYDFSLFFFTNSFQAVDVRFRRDNRFSFACGYIPRMLSLSKKKIW